jgi:membrane-associated phospholipid phosphatase
MICLGMAGFGLSARCCELTYDEGIARLLIPPSGDPSFPSDHATALFAIAAVVLAHRFRGAVVFLAAAFLISGPRKYIGTHYVSEVVRGALTVAPWSFSSRLHIGINTYYD